MFKPTLNNATKVDPTGKVYLKKDVRELAGLNPGDAVKLLVNEEKQEILIKIVNN